MPFGEPIDPPRALNFFGASTAKSGNCCFGGLLGAQTERKPSEASNQPRKQMRAMVDNPCSLQGSLIHLLWIKEYCGLRIGGLASGKSSLKGLVYRGQDIEFVVGINNK
ncbi:hypothetical protein ACMD2_13977 [Ananas comosus]|uniref:Uncharacterized protein n=1 Tax=Ananas comosus TaxID=4615 RepID=A0A199V131_ANACO|nr:hypothetical protein ACMD2_13977 [Ananas comosus]